MEEEYEENVPDFLNAEAFIAARLKELTALTTVIGERTQVTNIFQRLPKHMRRRAMSHSIKRVPRNLRPSHKKQLMKNKALKKPKKVRKRHRKRPKQLMLGYKKRQVTKRWLETHIWHAKRFRMSTKWNHKIAENSYEKTFRAVFRATTSHCLLQDISYYYCVELRGSVNTIADTFKLITNPACGLSITAKCWLTGHREGNISIFHANNYPYNIIGNVDFMWKPPIQESDTRILWLWCHPSIHNEIVQEFIEIFALSSVEADLKHSYFTNVISNITMVLPENRLNRFRLTGPLTNSVLTKALHAAETYDQVLLNLPGNSWWLKFRSEMRESCNTLELLKTHPEPFLFPAHCILGCNILDPRLFLKRKRQKAVPESDGSDYFLSIPSNAGRSAIWEEEIRNEVSSQKLPTARLDVMRSELLIPGFEEQLLKNVKNVIPILLIQRPGASVRGIKHNYGSGWDIVLPADWAMPIWLSLVLCGGRAGGLRETRTINFENQQAPEMCPDSKAGKEYYAELKLRHEDQYFKKPPKKRVNYVKFGIPTPFHQDWQLLVREWCSPESVLSYFVLRDRRLLVQIQEQSENFRSQHSRDTVSSLPSNALIPVTLSMLGKGQLTPCSHICVPLQSDIMRRFCDKHFVGPSEEPHPDIFKQQRKILRQQHVKELKRLRRKRIKEKRERMQIGLPSKVKKHNETSTEPVVQAYLRQMRNFWIPPEVTKLRKCCTREVGGFVITGGFSFSKSCVIGQGYIVAEALKVMFKLAEKCRSDLVVLTRSPNSLNYRFCRINIIV